MALPENLNELPPADPSLYGAPPPPKTVEEALLQRLEKFQVVISQIGIGSNKPS